MRVSDYNIYIPIGNDTKEYLMVHGYSGAVDVVPEHIAKLIMNAANNQESLLEIPEDICEVMKKRGYLTEKSHDDEKEFFSRVAQAMHNYAKRYMGLTVVPSYDCNFRCRYCFEKGNFSKGNKLLEKTMDSDLVDEIFEAAKVSENVGRKVEKSITLFGGEPLRKENFEIIKYIVNKSIENGYKIGAITNGYDLDYYEELLSKDKISELQITLDGIGKFHDKKRYRINGKPTFDKIVDNIDNLLDSGIKISVRSNIDGDNLHQIGELIKFYNEKGWTRKDNFSYNFKSVYTCKVKEEHEITDKDISQELLKYKSKGEHYKYVGQYSRLYHVLYELLKNNRMMLLKAEFCGSVGGGMVVVDPYGFLYPCWEVIGDEQHIIGKIEGGKFVYNDNFSYWSDRSVNKIEQCSTCAYGMFCGGGCPAHAKSIEGDIYKAHCEQYSDVFNEVLLETYNRLLQESVI
ncbi:radical SAM protein [Acetivibrio clariflavus]|uniref:radical SAM/SPASM domain-containing protein n=1 Tax=Acetivibrio clariflavus TaxID=288965 RepID=UPI0031F4BE3F